MAITNEATIRVKIDGKDAEVSVKNMGKAIETAMKRGKAEADKLKSSFTKIGDAAQRFYFSFQSLRIFINGAANFVRAANQQEVAVAGMEQAFRSMGRYTETFSKQIQDLAKQIQSEGIIGDEAILEGTKFLATYKDIADNVMPRAMRVMTDIAALMGGDVRNAANMVGKASMGMVGELRRAGITISEATMKSKDFNSILREIEEQVGGQNKALAATSAGGMKQFANAWGDLKEVIGEVMKQSITPFMKLLTQLFGWIQQVDIKLIGMVGTFGLLSIALIKLIPIIKTLGVTSKLALGWIGAILIVIGELYTAWVTNFDGMQDSIKNLWNVMVEFYDKIRNWSELLSNIFKSLGDVINMALSGRIKDLQSAIVYFLAALGVKLDIEWKKIENKIVPKKELVVPKFQEAGEAAADAFVKGFKGATATGGPRGGKGGFAMVEMFDELEDRQEPIAQVFHTWAAAIGDVRNIAQDAFATLDNGIYQLSLNITQIMFGMKNNLRQIFKGMAIDFVSLFINEVLRQVAKVLVVKLLEMLALFDKAQNDQMAIRIGRDYARFFTQGVLQGLNTSQLSLAMAGGASAGFSDGNIIKVINGTNARLQKIESALNGIGSAPNINIKIGSRELYEGMKQGRELDLIRRGKEINNDLFS